MQKNDTANKNIEKTVPGKREPAQNPLPLSTKRNAQLSHNNKSAFERLKAQSVAILQNAVENRRLLILQPFALITGILLYRTPTFEPNGLALFAVAAVLLTCLFVSRANQVFSPVFLILCGIWSGVILLPIHGKLFGTQMVYGAIYGQFSARVDKIHSNDSERARIIISQIASIDGRSDPPIRRARILVSSAQVPQVGDIIESAMRLYRVPGPVVPGGFDSQFHAYFDGIGAFGSATGDLVITHPMAQASISRYIQNLRDFVGKRIDLALSAPVSGIARALIVGDQGQVNDEIRQNLAAAGLAHVLAISGLHLSLVAGGVFAIIRLILASSYFLGQRISVKKIAAIGGLLAALFYLALSGASVSAIRATLMLMLIFGAVLSGRRALTMRNVAIAALVVIIIDPASIFRPSFQLSFAAVTALVGTYERFRPFPHTQKSLINKWLGFAGGIALTSLIAGAATALFAAYHFQQVAPLGVFGNMLAIPLVSFIVLPFALFAVLLIPFGAETIAFKIMGWGIEQIIGIANNISASSANIFSAPILGSTALLIGFAGLAWFAFFPTRVRFIGLGIATICLPLFGTMPPPDILIADTTKAIAMRGDTELELVAGRGGSFAVRAWGETYIQPIEVKENSDFCDISGCIYLRKQFTVSLIKTQDAFFEDCTVSNLVISRIEAPQYCKEQTQTIDASDLQIKGVHWAKWTGKEFWIRPAITDIYRPWRPQYPKYN